MQRRKSATGAIALLALVLAACTGGSGEEGADDGKPGSPGSPTKAAQPGKYRTLPEACGAVDQDALDSLLKGLKSIPDEIQRERAYAGTALATYNTDRRVGCSWKAESTEATQHLSVDFERVVSYDPAVSDATRAEDVYAKKATAAGISPVRPSGSGDAEDGDKGAEGEDEGGKGAGGEEARSSERGARGAARGLFGSAADAASTAGRAASGDRALSDEGDRALSDEKAPSGEESPSGKKSPAGEESPDPGESGSGAGEDLPSRALDDLGDSAFLDDKLGESSSPNRTVTVVFRTSNVIVTIQYEDQPVGAVVAPDSKEMQDRARGLASRLADKLDD
ncbi:hypothetical protein SLNWT_2797 [Streptomyces albus]|uniref:DUF3558 domain-containing protein n=1 Tax=Streptomyces albus (strain ATCC 21838 / DSM 41398 / FERM P-419 / JCM 4703 / NBRC 107858) TaxID=1081613 RepID=A0A0B5ELA5_STRA4|nr:hypothetical protein SLNWT_2797 [Streptomyces albus]AOU77484.1 hypothetical protein SLNHY_2793 [Streptomyces albus]AYN33257.1 hypothetical protein DUI70_2756 [Streptomyces albus]